MQYPDGLFCCHAQENLAAFCVSDSTPEICRKKCKNMVDK